MGPIRIRKVLRDAMNYWKKADREGFETRRMREREQEELKVG